MLYIVIEKAIEEFKAENDREAMKLLYNNNTQLNAVIKDHRVYDHITELYYSDSYNVENMIRYLEAVAEYERCYEAMKIAKTAFEDVAESIFGTEW